MNGAKDVSVISYDNDGDENSASAIKGMARVPSLLWRALTGDDVELTKNVFDLDNTETYLIDSDTTILFLNDTDA